MTVAIVGGTVVGEHGETRADVLIDGTLIVAVGDGRGWSARTTVDASGCLVLPGGVDVHTHLEYPVAGFTAWTEDDIAAGTVAAAMGGTTSLIDFVKTPPGATIRETFDDRRARIEDAAAVDMGLHVIIPPAVQQPDIADDLAYVVGQGVTSWKFFMAYPGLMLDDGELLRGFDLARRHGVLPMVHAENGHMIAHDTEALVAAGRTAEAQHAAAHSHDSEAEAVERAAALARVSGVPLYVVHVSSAAAAQAIRRLRSEGAAVYAETCPQYLALAYEDYADKGNDAAGYLCSPPIRERANQEPLWEAVRDGTVDTVATDHAGFCLGHEGAPGRKLSSPGYFPGVPNGVPGVHERLMVLWQAGVVERGLRPADFVRLTSGAPARLFGLAHRKGVVAPGHDADLLVWDPAASTVLRAGATPLASDYSVYAGMTVSASPRHVLVGGRTVVFDGRLVDDTAAGHYLVRRTP